MPFKTVREGVRGCGDGGCDVKARSGRNRLVGYERSGGEALKDAGHNIKVSCFILARWSIHGSRRWV
jgi:hypothetical protein